MSAAAATAAGRDFASVAMALAWAQGLLTREDQEREIAVIVDGIARFVVWTSGDRQVGTRRVAT